jgi:hypothetical protein
VKPGGSLASFSPLAKFAAIIRPGATQSNDLALTHTEAWSIPPIIEHYISPDP